MRIVKFLILFILCIQLYAQNMNDKKPIIIKKDKHRYSLINYNKSNSTLINKDSLHTLYIHSDSTIFFSWLLNPMNGQDYFMMNEPFDHYYRIPEGKYCLVVNFIDNYNHPSVFYFTDIYLDNTKSITINKDSCNKKQTIEITNIEQQLLNYNNIMLIFHQNNETKLVISDISYPNRMNNYTVMFNEYPNSTLNFGYRIISKPNNLQKDYYYISGKFKNVDSSIVITNDINNLNHSKFKYYFGTSNIPDNKNLTVEFFPPGHFFQDDPNLEWPLNISVYQDITYSEVLNWANFYNIIMLGDITWGNLMTLQMKVGKDRVYGKLFSNNEIYIPLSETPDVIFGLTPSFFNGKMNNTQDSIRLFGKWGWYDFDDNHNQLFLSQTNDAFLQNPLQLKIKNIAKDSTLMTNNLSLPEMGGEVNIRQGLPRNLLVYSVPPDKYEVTITNDKNEIAGDIPSVITAKTVCDLTKEDKNPPGLNSFQIVGGSSLSHSLKSNEVNVIRFFPVDSVGISSMELYYKEESESEWHSLDIEVMDEHYYKAVLPELWMGTFSLKLVLSDSSGNTLEMRQEPAFVYSAPDGVEEATELNPYKFEISEGYPNPFNMEINFSYNIPVNSAGRITAEIYNILGEKVKTLLNEEVAPGIHKLKWDGRNESNAVMPSGIYLLKLKNSNRVIVKKLMLLK